MRSYMVGFNYRSLQHLLHSVQLVFPHFSQQLLIIWSKDLICSFSIWSHIVECNAQTDPCLPPVSGLEYSGGITCVPSHTDSLFHLRNHLLFGAQVYSVFSELSSGFAQMYLSEENMIRMLNIFWVQKYDIQDKWITAPEMLIFRNFNDFISFLKLYIKRQWQ